ncbi:MAG: hypothetical protein U1F57_03440 [bacterium]
MALETQRVELEKLGFKIVQQTEDSLAATRKKWHWDCLFTRISYVVFVYRVSRLTAERVESDRIRLVEEGKKLDTSFLPRGFQKGVAVLVLYVADEIDEAARVLIETKPKVRFAFFYLPSAFDQKRQTAVYLKDNPIWGWLYYPKFRGTSLRLLSPIQHPGGEPVSLVGVGMTAFIAFILLVEFAVILRFYVFK